MLPPDPRQLSVNKVVAHVAEMFTPSSSDLTLQALLDEADLHPTQQTAYLMATAAVTTLLAHDLGVKITGPLKTIEHTAPAQLPAAAPEPEPPAAPKQPRHTRKAVAKRAAAGNTAGKAAGVGSKRTPAPNQPARARKPGRPSRPANQFPCPAPGCLGTFKTYGWLAVHIQRNHPDTPLPPRP